MLQQVYNTTREQQEVQQEVQQENSKFIRYSFILLNDILYNTKGHMKRISCILIYFLIY